MPKDAPPSLLFLHGFMGCERDGAFLQSLEHSCPLSVHTLPVPHQVNIDLEKFFTAIDQLSPSIIYGYSLGGRLALRYLQERTPDLRMLILESASLGLSDPQAREARWSLDQRRALAIEQDLHQFLRDWYAMDLWGPLREHQREQKIRVKLERWSGREQDLAAAITTYSPGRWPISNIAHLNLPVHYIYGAEDQRYRTLAQQLAPHQHLHLHEIAGVGHCIHQSEQRGKLQSILQTIVSV